MREDTLRRIEEFKNKVADNNFFVADDVKGTSLNTLKKYGYIEKTILRKEEIYSPEEVLKLLNDLEENMSDYYKEIDYNTHTFWEMRNNNYVYVELKHGYRFIK